MSKISEETRGDFSKMKNLWQVKQNPEDEALDGKRRGKSRIHFVFLHQRSTFSKTLQAGLWHGDESRDRNRRRQAHH